MPVGAGPLTAVPLAGEEFPASPSPGPPPAPDPTPGGEPVDVPAPPITRFGADCYSYLQPLAARDPFNGFVLKRLCGAIGEAFRQVEEVARSLPGGEPYQQTYDIDRTPDYMLGWLGQLVGVPWTPYTDPVAKRQQVREEVGFTRGSIANILAAAAANQTAAARTTIIERYTGDPWQIGVAYDPAYTPDVTAYENAVRAAVPWGIKITFSSTSVPLFDEGTLIPDTLSSSLTFDTATLADIT